MSDKDNIMLPREVVQFMLRHLEWWSDDEPQEKEAIEALRTHLAAPKQEFDHGIGADRFKVVRGAFWWHIKIGDSPTEHGKFRSSEAAQKMADDLLREFRNGAFVQSAALAAPPEDIEALRRDAKRYRWLRGMIYDDRIIVEADRMLYGADLDAAIDAAMKEGKR